MTPASNATRNPYPSEPSEFTPRFSEAIVTSCLVSNVACLCVRPFLCGGVVGGLSFDLRRLINPLIFSTFSHKMIENK